MYFHPTSLNGAYIVERKKNIDHRGSFSRLFCRNEFSDLGLNTEFPQLNICENKLAGTIRGLHSQSAPNEEIKFVSCLHGSIYDVVVDMRTGSPTYLQHFGVELSLDNGLGILVPKGCYHGYQTLEDGATIVYCVSEPYAPGSEKGLAYNDPLLQIAWPLPISTISSKDSSWPHLSND